jgi:hypothetical protein
LEKVEAKIPIFTSSFAKGNPFGVSKGYLLQACKGYLCGIQKDSFRRPKWEYLEQSSGSFGEKKLPENLQTTVSSEYQGLTKWPQNSRI